MCKICRGPHYITHHPSRQFTLNMLPWPWQAYVCFPRSAPQRGCLKKSVCRGTGWTSPRPAAFADRCFKPLNMWGSSQAAVLQLQSAPDIELSHTLLISCCCLLHQMLHSYRVNDKQCLKDRYRFFCIRVYTVHYSCIFISLYSNICNQNFHLITSKYVV